MPELMPAAPETADLTEAQLQATFLAARSFGKILDDDVLRAIVAAVRDA